MNKSVIKPTFFSLLYPLMLLLLLASCADIKDSDITPGLSFNKSYNSRIPDDNIYPMDIKQTPDGGYLVLSETGERRIHLLKVNKLGEVETDTLVGENYLSPLPLLTKVENNFVFFCMDQGGSGFAVKVPADTLTGIDISPIGLSYPLSVGNTQDNGFIIQHWNRVDKKTILTKLAPSLTVSATRDFDIFEEMDEKIFNHYLRTGSRLPFLSGSTFNNRFYFNGYYNYNFGLVFVNESLEITGNSSGNKTNTFVTALEAINTNKFAVATSAYQENYLSPLTDINVNNVSVVDEIKVDYTPEMSADIPVITKKVSVNGVEIILCAFTTKTKQVALYGYKIDTGELLGKRVIGNTHPYEIGNFSSTEDGGLVIVAKTHIAGKFPREAIIKYSKDEFISMFPKK